jgi:16S rRNA (uracil1498-N3)-methyltransferase
VYTGSALKAGSIVELPPDAATHLQRVLRARSGDEIVLFGGDGQEFAATVESIRGSKVTAIVHDGGEVDRESPLMVTLVQCVPRGDRMDFIVQKATELGVARIVPVLSQRSVVRLDAGQAQAKVEHWRGVAVSACEQCGRNRLPTIDTPGPLIAYLADSTDSKDRESRIRLVLDPEAPRGHSDPVNGGAEIAIGPEGGFTADELEAFRVSGFTGMRLGPRVMRTETAAIAAIAWLQTRFGDLIG